MKEKLKRAIGTKEGSAFIILVCVIIIATIFNPTFLTYSNFMDVLKANTVLGICALGMLMIILTGGIDASVCGQLTLISVLAGEIIVKTGVSNVFVLYVFALIVGAITGTINGLLVSRLELPPIIATLGLDSVIMGFVKYYTNGTWINLSQYGNISAFGMIKLFSYTNESGSVIGFPIQLVLFGAMMLITWFLLKRTLLGRSIMAMGSNRISAERIGLKVKSLNTFAYTYAGMMYGFAAITYICIMNAVDPNAFLGFEMDVIGAVVLGGALLSGGSGSVLGTFLGVLLFAFISNGLTLAHISTYWQNIIVGFIILLAVSFDMIKLHREERLQTKVDIIPKEVA